LEPSNCWPAIRIAGIVTRGRVQVKTASDDIIRKISPESGTLSAQSAAHQTGIVLIEPATGSAAANAMGVLAVLVTKHARPVIEDKVGHQQQQYRHIRIRRSSGSIRALQSASPASSGSSNARDGVRDFRRPSLASLSAEEAFDSLFKVSCCTLLLTAASGDEGHFVPLACLGRYIVISSPFLAQGDVAGRFRRRQNLPLGSF
jgi:hypothetical protein